MGDDLTFEVGHLPTQIDPEIEKNLQPAEIGFKAPNPKKYLPNQDVRKKLSDVNSADFPVPKLLSEKGRDVENDQSTDRRISDAAMALTNASLSEIIEVPWYYGNFKAKYGKYGVVDFDFR